MKKLIFLLVLLYGCSKDPASTPNTVSTGDSVSITVNITYEWPTRYVRWSLQLPSLNGHGVNISGTTSQAQLEWHYNIGIADTLLFAQVMIYFDTTQAVQSLIHDTCSITIWSSHHYPVSSGKQEFNEDFQQKFRD